MRFLIRFANEEGNWIPWDVMTEYNYDGGADFPDLEEGWETRNLWVSVPDKDVDKALNTPDLEGKVE